MFNILLKKVLILKQKIDGKPLLFTLHVNLVFFQLFNILLKKELILKLKIILEKLLFILHVKTTIFQSFNILLKKVLILKQKITGNKLLFIVLHFMVKLMLSRIYFPMEQIKMPQTKMEKHHMMLHVIVVMINHKKISSKNSSNKRNKKKFMIHLFWKPNLPVRMLFSVRPGWNLSMTKLFKWLLFVLLSIIKTYLFRSDHVLCDFEWFFSKLHAFFTKNLKLKQYYFT